MTRSARCDSWLWAKVQRLMSLFALHSQELAPATLSWWPFIPYRISYSVCFVAGHAAPCTVLQPHPDHHNYAFPLQHPLHCVPCGQLRHNPLMQLPSLALQPRPDHHHLAFPSQHPLHRVPCGWCHRSGWRLCRVPAWEGTLAGARPGDFNLGE